MRWPEIHLENAQDVFALPETIQEHAHRPDVDGVRAQPHQMAVQARQLRQHHARPLRQRRNLQAQQFLHRQAVAQIIRERRQVIDAVGQRNRLLVRLDLEFLLDAGVQIPDVRLALYDGLAIQLQFQAQHAVRGGMLRTHVQAQAARPRAARRYRRRLGNRCSNCIAHVCSCLKPGRPLCCNPCAADALPNRPAA